MTRSAKRWPTSRSHALTDSDEIRAVIEAVNEGIDAHLEACFCPARGDRYEGGKRKAGKLVMCRTFECTSALNPFPLFSEDCANPNLVAIPTFKPREIGLPPTSSWCWASTNTARWLEKKR